MPFPLIPLAIGAGALWFIKKKAKPKAVVAPPKSAELVELETADQEMFYPTSDEAVAERDQSFATDYDVVDVPNIEATPWILDEDF